jgi:hypothetical protein
VFASEGLQELNTNLVKERLQVIILKLKEDLVRIRWLPKERKEKILP